MNGVNKLSLNDFHLRYFIGIDFFKKQNYHAALLFLLMSARKNFHLAQYFVGLIYFEGLGTIRNLDKAKEYFTLAAENYNIKAAFKLGLIYFVEKKYDLAIYNFKLATNYKKTYESLFNIGLIYKELNKKLSNDIELEKNDDIKSKLLIEYNKNKELAIKYFKLAADKNNTKAIKELEELSL